MSSSRFIALFLAVNLAVMTNAFPITLIVRDINNKQPINAAAADIRGNESQPINDSMTQADGIARFSINESLTYYEVKLTKLGYHPRTDNYTWAAAETVPVYMYPISDDGIIRVRFTDLTYGQREYCIYYAANDRLATCLYDNETATLLVNQRFVIRPKIEMADLAASEDSIKSNSLIIGGLFAGSVILALLAAMALAVFWRATK